MPYLCDLRVTVLKFARISYESDLLKDGILVKREISDYYGTYMICFSQTENKKKQNEFVITSKRFGLCRGSAA